MTIGIGRQRSELLALANAASGAQEAEVRDKLDKVLDPCTTHVALITS